MLENYRNLVPLWLPVSKPENYSSKDGKEPLMLEKKKYPKAGRIIFAYVCLPEEITCTLSNR